MREINDPGMLTEEEKKAIRLAADLIDCAVMNKVLHPVFIGEEAMIPVYREESEMDPERFPRGWYLESEDALALELALDQEGQEALIGALREKGVEFVPQKEHPLPDGVLDAISSLNEEELEDY